MAKQRVLKISPDQLKERNRLAQQKHRAKKAQEKLELDAKIKVLEMSIRDIASALVDLDIMKAIGILQQCNIQGLPEAVSLCAGSELIPYPTECIPEPQAGSLTFGGEAQVESQSLDSVLGLDQSLLLEWPAALQSTSLDESSYRIEEESGWQSWLEEILQWEPQSNLLLSSSGDVELLC